MNWHDTNFVNTEVLLSLAVIYEMIYKRSEPQNKVLTVIFIKCYIWYLRITCIRLVAFVSIYFQRQTGFHSSSIEKSPCITVSFCMKSRSSTVDNKRAYHVGRGDFSFRFLRQYVLLLASIAAIAVSIFENKLRKSSR